jgi:hypothetical protein
LSFCCNSPRNQTGYLSFPWAISILSAKFGKTRKELQKMTNQNNLTLHYCNYMGYCPHQCTCRGGTPAPLPIPAYNATLALEVGCPEYEKAINQLQELAQHGYTAFPAYSFSVSYDSENRPTWQCECSLHGWGCTVASFPSKRLAKHAAAFEMLCRVLAF